MEKDIEPETVLEKYSIDGDGWKAIRNSLAEAYQAGIRRAVEKIHGTKVTTGNAEAQ